MNEETEALGQIPRGRLMHFFGRATEYPKLIHALRSDDPDLRRSARTRLRETLEHQDGVGQATPYTIPFLLELAAEPQVPDLLELLALLRHVLAAVMFHAEGPLPLPDVSGLDLGTPIRLWPEFESEEKDEILWEDYEETHEEWRGWQALTLRAFDVGRPHLESLVNHTDPQVRGAALSMLESLRTRKRDDGYSFDPQVAERLRSARLLREVGEVPVDYRDFLHQAAPELTPNDRVSLYSLDYLAERNATYEVADTWPGWLMIGDDSGGCGVFLRCDGDGAVGLQDLGAPEPPMVVASSFSEWLGAGAPYEPPY